MTVRVSGRVSGRMSGRVIMAALALAAVVACGRQVVGPALPPITPLPTPSPRPTALTIPPPLAPPVNLTPQPGTPIASNGLIVDRKAGISYARLAKPWNRERLDWRRDFTDGQYFTAERPKRAVWPFAEAFSTPMNAKWPEVRAAYTGASPERAAAEEFAGEFVNANAPNYGTKVTWTASQALAVPGARKSWLIAFRQDYVSKDLTSTASVGAVVVIKHGGKDPALFAANIPNTDPRRWADLNVLLSSLRAAST